MKWMSTQTVQVPVLVIVMTRIQPFTQQLPKCAMGWMMIAMGCWTVMTTVSTRLTFRLGIEILIKTALEVRMTPLVSVTSPLGMS